jgi:hypothetical protein
LRGAHDTVLDKDKFLQDTGKWVMHACC